MIARIQTALPISAARAWGLVLRRDTFLTITRGLLGFGGAGAWPERFEEGASLRTRLWFFHVIPAWSHTLRLARVDHGRRELRSEEHGGPIRVWNHRIHVESDGESRCRYTDEIEIEAGPLTPLVWLFAHLFYRYRQARWRKLAQTHSLLLTQEL